MSPSEPHEIPFTGVRLRVESDKTYDELVSALFADIGAAPVPVDDFSKTLDSWEAYSRRSNHTSEQADSSCSPCSITAGGSRSAGIDRKALRVIIGNPLIAITMMRHDVSAGLFAPVELLVLEEDDGRSSITYVKPSSLMVVEPNPPLLAAAEELDAKLAALVAKVT